MNIMQAKLSADRPDGDVNQDGKENIFDVLELLKALSGSSYSSASDVNQDSKTDIFDLLALLKVLSGWYDDPPAIAVSFNGISVNAGDSLVAYNSVTINITFKGNLDSSTVIVNGERVGNDLEFNEFGSYLIEVKAFGNEQMTEMSLVCILLEGYTITGSLVFNEVGYPDVNVCVTGSEIDTIISTQQDGSYFL